MTLTLSRAMRLKNRIASRISTLRADIHKYNSVDERLKVPIDLQAVWDEMKSLTDSLVTLKTAIAQKSVEIQEQIHTMAELKSMISFLQMLNPGSPTKLEQVYDRSTSSTKQQVVVISQFMNKEDVDGFIRDAEITIDALSEQVDKFNATSILECDIPESVLGSK